VSELRIRRLELEHLNAIEVIELRSYPTLVSLDVRRGLASRPSSASARSDGEQLVAT